MNNQLTLKPKQVLAFLETGAYHWRLALLPLFGAGIAFISFEISENATSGEIILPFSFAAIFYTVFLYILFWHGSLLSNRLFVKQVIALIIQWPISVRQKQFWLAFRGTWMPAGLLLLGAALADLFVNGPLLWLLLKSLPYGLAACFFISVTLWRGTFSVADLGIIKISSREEVKLSFLNLFVLVSPVLVSYLNSWAELTLACFLFGLTIVMQRSPKLTFQITNSADSVDRNERESNQTILSFSERVKSKSARIFMLLSWDSIIQPIKKLFILNFGTVSFIVFVYYAINGLFSASSALLMMERGMFLSIHIGFATALMPGSNSIMTYDDELTLTMLPTSLLKKVTIRMTRQFIETVLLNVFNIMLITTAIWFTHSLLNPFISQPELKYGLMVIYTLKSSLLIIPLVLAVMGLLELLLNTVIVLAQRLITLKAFNWALVGGIFIPSIPLVVLAFLNISSGQIYVRLVSYPLALMAIGVFLITRMGIYWTSKKIQVVAG
ncbi:hypothetical protein SAMN04488134_103262 [Amphibacillus marinus]|uniref:Uncharacterized protein n=1 Tax=Amphibacillus marinus TaxID=872970 RepID=A0A1H8LMG2_9BACI|nr:hypothetical protein [Amphibacillus marinus]SEO06344.1 hypothetical protein SAMN04488134_103262 [Amphibacillus marinus]